MKVERIAAIDLGSNSFHMLLAESSINGFTVYHKEKRQVALAKGLNDKNQLSDESIELALQTLQLFASVLAQFRPDTVRIVGTFTFRTAKNISKLTKPAQKFLPYPIEIMSGTEEARLIFEGVSHNNVLTDNHLVVDIGGGSTEMIIGKDHTPLQLHSCDMGCVSLSSQFFNGGEITERSFKKAIIFAEQQLDPIKKRYRKTGWRHVMGTSGTIKAIYSFVVNEATDNDPDINPSDIFITLKALKKIKATLIKTEKISSIELAGVNESRYGVICGGLAVLIAVFEIMKIDSMSYCDYALREGLIAEIEDRIQLNDIRDFSVSQLCSRFNVDVEQAFRVEKDALLLFDNAQDHWQFKFQSSRTMLRWACQLHEAGIHINHLKSHQHAHYVVSNATLSGFNQEQQEVLAYIVLSQRKALRPELIPELSSHVETDIFKIILLLRIAILLNRFRQEEETYCANAEFSKNKIQLLFGEEWLSGAELFSADLEKEQHRFAKIDLALEFSFSESDSSS